MEELVAEYGFTKLSYILANANKTFYVTCTSIDHKRNKTFIEHSNGEHRIKNAEHKAARKIFKILENSYHFSEERNVENEIEYTYASGRDRQSRMLVKL